MAAKRRKKRPRRKDCFLGIHFIAEPSGTRGPVASAVTRPMIRSIVEAIEPDYVQCDAKTPDGLALYPTEVGTPMRGLARDLLRLWRDVTAARGIALYVRLPGMVDPEAVRRHRSWARTRADGKRDRRCVSVFSPYTDDLLLPELKELADRYRLDGVCVDGECAAVAPDYTPAVRNAFRKETGVRRLPTRPTQKHWPALADFCRDAFRRHLRRWVDEMHVHAPELEVASGSAFGHGMPEPVTADVDYLTAAVPPNDSVRAARLLGRCLQHQGKPWDLRLSACRRRPDGGCGTAKSADQVKQEAAVALALGGGVAVALPLKRDGTVYAWQIDATAEVADFCRRRQPQCHGGEPVPQIALLFANRAYDAQGPHLMRPGDGQLDAVRGLLDTLLGFQDAVDVTMPHHLAGRFDAYPLIVVPEWTDLEGNLVASLLAYAEGGGNLLVVGPDAARPFADALGVTFKGKARPREQYLAFDGRLAAVHAPSATVQIKGPADPVGRLYEANEAKGNGRPAASVIDYGDGRVAATYLNLGEGFGHAATGVARRFFRSLVRGLFPKPMVTIADDVPIDVSVVHIGGQLVVHLVNTGGPHADPTVETFDRVPRLGPLAVRVRTDRRPERVYLQPGTRHLPFHFKDGAAEIELPRLDIHEVIVLEQADS